jgi:hypothetical protein
MGDQKNVMMATGLNQEAVVDLLDKVTGRIWIPISAFSDIGNATLGAVGSTTTVGMLFDKDTDEHVSYNLVLPKDADVSKPMYAYVYWSSAGTSASETFLAALSSKASADTEDVGGTHTITLSTADVNSATADALRITPAITIAADFLASTEELWSMSLYRDVSGDDAGEDVTVYGMRIDYTPKPFVKTGD